MAIDLNDVTGQNDQVKGISSTNQIVWMEKHLNFVGFVTNVEFYV